MHSYRMAGLTVSSEIPLPGARPAADAQPDVVMRRASVPAGLDGAAISLSGWDWDGERFLVRAPGVGRFLLSGGCEVEFEPEDGASVADCAVYLQGSVFGMLLHQRGLVVLHASAVEVNGSAVLICGRSGLGKSTLAAALCGRGYPLLSDDVSAIDFDKMQQPLVRGDARRLKLGAEAIRVLALDRQRGAPVLRNTEKFYVEPGIDSRMADASVAAVYVLRQEGPDCPVGLVELDNAKAVRILLRTAYRPQVVKHTGQTARHFEAAAAIAETCSVMRLTRANDLDRLSDSVALMERHWANIGLSADAKHDSLKQREKREHE